MPLLNVKNLNNKIMSELKAEQFYNDVKDFMDLEKDGFTKFTETGISPNYESIFDFAEAYAEAYYAERKANETNMSENKKLCGNINSKS